MYKNFQNRPYIASYKRRQYFNRRFQKNPPAEHRFLGSIFSGIGNLIMLPFRRRKISTPDKKIIIKRWYRVRKMISRGEEVDLRSAVIEADKIMDYTLSAGHFRGERFGERIRSARSFFPRKIYSGVWEAHILRNELVHHIDSNVNKFQAKDAVIKIKNGLKSIKGF